jgi:hypothetical protein
MDEIATRTSRECLQMQSESINSQGGACNTEQICADGRRNKLLLHTECETSAGWGVPHPFIRKY